MCKLPPLYNRTDKWPPPWETARREPICVDPRHCDKPNTVLVSHKSRWDVNLAARSLELYRPIKQYHMADTRLMYQPSHLGRHKRSAMRWMRIIRDRCGIFIRYNNSRPASTRRHSVRISIRPRRALDIIRPTYGGVLLITYTRRTITRIHRSDITRHCPTRADQDIIRVDRSHSTIARRRGRTCGSCTHHIKG